MPVTLKDVAELAGVSRSAVSRTFTDGASVSAKMRRKIERAVNELGYSPNALASSLTTGRTKMIGLVSNNFRNPVFLQIFDLFTRGLQERGLRPLLVNLSDEDQPEHAVRMLRQYAVDGVIMASSTLPPSLALRFRDAGIPVVHSFGRKSVAPGVHIVGIDNEECGRIAARTFAERGYGRVAFLGGPETATSTVDRLVGFREELACFDMPPPAFTFAGAYSFDAGRAEMQRIISGGSTAEAYFCGDDVLSIGALSALRDAGLRVPDNIGILGLNDMEMARWQNINLTTIHQPFAEIIESSVDLVVSLLNAPLEYSETRILPCHLVERGTLRPLLGNEPPPVPAN